MDDHDEEELIKRKRSTAQKKVELQQQQKAALHCLQLQKALGAELLMVKSNIDHRLFERNAYVVYDHERAAYCIRSDYLGRVPRFDGKEFQTMFRVSRSRFQRIMEDIGSTEDPFYTNTVNGAGREGASFEARLMLPLKSMAYGVPPHCFRDYFQMLLHEGFRNPFPEGLCGLVGGPGSILSDVDTGFTQMDILFLYPIQILLPGRAVISHRCSHRRSARRPGRRGTGGPAWRPGGWSIGCCWKSS